MVTKTFPIPKPHELSRALVSLVRYHMWAQVLAGMVLGIGVGIALGPTVGWVAQDTATFITAWLAFPGRLFLALIQMIVIPLVFASIVVGLTSGEDVEQLKRLGLGSLIFFVSTTAVAILIGIGFAWVLKPGAALDSSSFGPHLRGNPGAQSAPPTLEDLPGHLIGLLPNNPLNSMAEGQMLQVVVFAIVFGTALVMMPRNDSRPLLQILNSIQAACMTVVKWAMLLAPFAVFGLVTQLASQIGLSALIGMAFYVGTVILGLATLFVIYLLIVKSLGGFPIGKFLVLTREVLLLAFSTSSSAAVMPLSIKAAQEGLGVKESIAKFVIPLGATINMAGTALYQGAATVFLAQVFDIALGPSQIMLVVLMSVGASIGSPATPGVGIVILSMVLSSVGIPPSGVALIMGVDRILDMSRTALNVCGDLVACRVLERWSADAPSIEAAPTPV